MRIYDKPGYGWSDITNAPRDIDTMIKEIHEVLSKAGEKPPYIYVAHSIALLEAIRFAQLYPDEVGEHCFNRWLQSCYVYQYEKAIIICLFAYINIQRLNFFGK